MVIYANTKRDFIGRVSDATIADYIEDLVRLRLHRETPKAEKAAWRNSLDRMGMILAGSKVPDDAGIAIEYTIPMSSKRIDMLISGVDEKNVPQVVIIELKQWEKLSAVKDQNDIVETYVGGRIGPHPHPSYQAWSYAQFVKNTSVVVQDRNVGVWPCAYLHNYVRQSSGDPLDAVQYHRYEVEAPAFTHDDAQKLKDFISRYVRRGDAAKILYEIENGTIRPSKSLQDALSSMLEGNPEFVMIDNQKVVFESILFHARQAKHRRKKQVLIVQGGPGTGKSVVAINALVRLIGDGQIVHYVTKNQAPRRVFFERLRGNHTQAYINNLFRGSGCYVNAKENEFGTILVDEAHRLNEKSGMFHNQGENQIKEIINAAWCSVFFIDEHQQVTTYDAGSISEIENFAKAAGANLLKYRLTSQFRCNGSDGYLAWLDNILYGEESATTDLVDANYDFRVVDTPEELRRSVELRNTTGINARIVAGYCWEWSSEGRNNSNVHDITIGGFGISWNLGNTSTWAIDADSVKQAGCIHTCQGLEFEHIGVIIGEDMFLKDGQVCTDFTRRAHTDKSITGLRGMLRKDRSRAQKVGDMIVRNTYRTLLTRGSKSCTVYCCDRALAEYLKEKAHLAEKKPQMNGLVGGGISRIVSNVSEDERFVCYLPLYSYRAACGKFGAGESVEPEGWIRADGLRKINKRMFVLQAKGRSMEPKIHDGDYCVFEAPEIVVEKEGEILLVQYRGAEDPETGGAYTIKLFRSEVSDSSLKGKIALVPLNKEYASMVYAESDYELLRLVARFRRVL